MVKNSQRRNTNGVAFFSGGSSVFSNSKSKSIGVVQFFSGKSKIKSKTKPVQILIIEFKEYKNIHHPIENPHLLHESIGVSILINGPPIDYVNIFLNSPSFTPSYNKNLVTIKKYCELSVNGEDN